MKSGESKERCELGRSQSSCVLTTPAVGGRLPASLVRTGSFSKSSSPYRWSDPPQQTTGWGGDAAKSAQLKMDTKCRRGWGQQKVCFRFTGLKCSSMNKDNKFLGDFSISHLPWRQSLNFSLSGSRPSFTQLLLLLFVSNKGQY